MSQNDKKLIKMESMKLIKFHEKSLIDFPNWKKELQNLLNYDLPLAEEAFKIPNEDKKVKNQEWQWIELLRTRAVGLANQMESFKINLERVEKQQDDLFCGNFEQRPPRLTLDEKLRKKLNSKLFKIFF